MKMPIVSRPTALNSVRVTISSAGSTTSMGMKGLPALPIPGSYFRVPNRNAAMTCALTVRRARHARMTVGHAVRAAMGDVTVRKRALPALRTVASVAARAGARMSMGKTAIRVPPIAACVPARMVLAIAVRIAATARTARATSPASSASTVTARPTASASARPWAGKNVGTMPGASVALAVGTRSANTTSA